MNLFTKILVTIVIIAVFWVMLVALVLNNGNGRFGILGLILLGGMISGISAVWKKTPDDKNDDKHQLDKTD